VINVNDGTSVGKLWKSLTTQGLDWVVDESMVT
jgi:hypothetical protein